MIKLCCLILSIYCFPFVLSVNVDTVLQYKEIDFAYEDEETRQADIKAGIFNKGYITPYKIKATSEYVYMAIPRAPQKGVPATLGRVDLSGNNTLIQPFPNWGWNRNAGKGQNNTLDSVEAIKTDKCGRLWVLDSGVIDRKLACGPRLLAFLENGEFVHEYIIPADLITNISILTNFEIDQQKMKNCDFDSDKLFFFIADSFTNSLIVYDMKENESWKIQHDSFKPDTECVPNYYTGRENEAIGLTGMTLFPQGRLYYQALCSNAIYSIKTHWLKYPTAVDDDDVIFKYTFEGNKTGNGVSLVHWQNNIYFDVIKESFLNIWNRNTVLIKEHVRTVEPVKDQQLYTWLDVSDTGYIWTFTKPLGTYPKINPNNTNFYVGKVKIQDINTVFKK